MWAFGTHCTHQGDLAGKCCRSKWKTKTIKQIKVVFLISILGSSWDFLRVGATSSVSCSSSCYHFFLLFHVSVSNAQRWSFVVSRVGSVAGSGSTDIQSIKRKYLKIILSHILTLKNDQAQEQTLVLSSSIFWFSSLGQQGIKQRLLFPNETGTSILLFFLQAFWCGIYSKYFSWIDVTSLV